jgi:3-deoxy-manno-octulosonate cytidylyltransferase (CMP-KDO synthetase)
MQSIAIIPARYASTRFPGKPLAHIKGKTMIQRVYEQARQAVEEVWVATDDDRIVEAVTGFQGRSVLTSPHHKSGTDRVNEALGLIEQQTGKKYDIIINVQGDEPFIHPDQIQELIRCFNDPQAQIATLIKKISNNDEVFNVNLPKVIVNRSGHAIYFSRSPIPHIRNHPSGEWIHHYSFMKHIGMYGYRTQVLREITRLEPSGLELAESLEQNRWIEHGYKIKTALTQHENHPVDTPGDLESLLQSLFPES